ncbi:MAG: KEOPS complex subunit Pcc1 [Halobacteriota archaeon]
MSEHRSKRTTMLRSRYVAQIADTDTIFSAIAPELDAAVAGSRSTLSIRTTGETIIIEIESDDLASLRAATNSWLRLVMVATEIDAVATEELNPKPYKCD